MAYFDEATNITDNRYSKVTHFSGVILVTTTFVDQLKQVAMFSLSLGKLLKDN